MKKRHFKKTTFFLLFFTLIGCASNISKNKDTDVKESSSEIISSEEIEIDAYNQSIKRFKKINASEF